MLKHPFLDEEYSPNISYFLGGIEIYDREETLGEQLWKLDPKVLENREVIIEKYIIHDLRYLSYRHKFVLLNELENKLSDEHFDFSIVFRNNPDEHTSLAWSENEIDNPRKFFEDIFRVASKIWSGELERARLEDQSTW
jgi:hypothetical protein